MQGVQVFRIDDLVLIYEQLKEQRIQEVIDAVIEPHGNRTGLSLGHLISLWMCYLLSESDHRLSSVEEWAEENLLVLSAMSGQVVRSKDFTDDRLEQALDYLSGEQNWRLINEQLTANSLEIYDLEKGGTIRLDSAPMQGHQRIEAQGLFQHGYSKHHDARQGMLKVMLAAMDTQLNGSSYPIGHLTVPGNRADDELYIPMIKQCEQIFSQMSDTGRRLYVGDSKAGSLSNRQYILHTGNDYLMPLSRTILPEVKRRLAIDQMEENKYKKVYKKEGKTQKRKLVAQGFEQENIITYTDREGKEQQRKERTVYVLSTAYSESQKASFYKRIEKVETELEVLLLPSQGKSIPKTKLEIQTQVDEILRSHNMASFINVEIRKKTNKRKIRAYGDRPARIQIEHIFNLQISQDDQAIEHHIKTLGWQVYTTSTLKKDLSFKDCVWKYRYQNRIERRFDDLRNKIIPLVPIYLQKDNRIEALINLLMICLKVCAALEYKAAKALQAKGEELNQIYEGNPKRSTPRPTVGRLLKAFKGISLVVFKTDTKGAKPQVQMTELKQVQLKIIRLLGFEKSIYEEMDTKLNLSF